MSYPDFLRARSQLNAGHGFEPTGLPDHLFDFQREMVEWAVRQGRGAIFADCGMGKTPMALAWADQVHRKTGKPVLLLTPLAVGFQIVTEAAKFGHDAALSRDGLPKAPITVSNYVIASKGVEGILTNLQRKARQADRMFDALLEHMTDALTVQRKTDHTMRMELPTWAP